MIREELAKSIPSLTLNVAPRQRSDSVLDTLRVRTHVRVVSPGSGTVERHSWVQIPDVAEPSQIEGFDRVVSVAACELEGLRDSSKRAQSLDG